MDLSKFIADNLQLILSNPGPFITLSFIVFALSWFIFTIIHRERFAILQERLSSKDDQIKYYKELSETKRSGRESLIDNSLVTPSSSNLKTDILREIQFLKTHTGKALSVQLFERLQLKYDFTVILSEILSMNKTKELEWAGAPNPPEALSEISVIERKAS
jgi:hypothetical protein